MEYGMKKLFIVASLSMILAGQLFSMDGDKGRQGLGVCESFCKLVHVPGYAASKLRPRKRKHHHVHEQLERVTEDKTLPVAENVIPVTAHAVARGDVILPSDLDWRVGVVCGAYLGDAATVKTSLDKLIVMGDGDRRYIAEALADASSYDDHELIQLVAKHPRVVDAGLRPDLWTPALSKALKDNRPDRFSQLVSCGAQFDVADMPAFSSLCRAAIQGQSIDGLKALLSDLSLTREHGMRLWRALAKSKESDASHFVKLANENGFSVANIGWGYLLDDCIKAEAVENDTLRFIRTFRSPAPQGPWTMARAENEALLTFIHAQCSLDEKGRALKEAARRGYLSAVHIFSETLKENCGESLNVAIKHGHDHVAEVLMDKCTKDELKSAMLCAQRYGKLIVAVRLKGIIKSKFVDVDVACPEISCDDQGGGRSEGSSSSEIFAKLDRRFAETLRHLESDECV